MEPDLPEELEKAVRKIVHEINDTLGAILSVVRFLQRERSEDKLERGLKIIEEIARNGIEFASKLRKIIPDEPQENEFKEIDLIGVLRKLISLLPHPDLIDVRIILNAGPLERLIVRGNGRELCMAFEEIIRNGLEAIDENGMIEVRINRCDDEAIVEFIDTGSGMEEETMAQSFKPFFSTKGEGHLGLGLNVARGIVFKHGGRMEMRSRIGLGTRVKVILPIARR